MAKLGNVLQSAASGKVSTLVDGKLGFTPDGELAIKLTNKTGGTSVKGYLVSPYDASAIDLAFALTPDDTPDIIGVIYGDDDGNGVADGAECWVVVNGIVDVYFDGAVARGEFARAQVTADGGTIGVAANEAAPTSPFSTDKHFQEVGHIIETTGGTGLARCIIHFN